jgi:hypothetical protein
MMCRKLHQDDTQSFCSSEVLLRCEDAQRSPHAWLGKIAHINGSMAVGLSESEATVNPCSKTFPGYFAKVTDLMSHIGNLGTFWWTTFFVPSSSMFASRHPRLNASSEETSVFESM